MSADTHSDDRQSDLAVMDANEYKQKRRLERILDAHDNVEETANEAWDFYVMGEISNQAKDIMILRAVQQAIREAANLLREHRTQNGGESKYWDGSDQPLGGITFETRDPIRFWGLRDVLQAQELYRESWVETEHNRHYDHATTRHEETYTVPQSVTWRAYLLLKEFLSEEHDLELRFEDLEDSRPYNDWREEYEDGVYG